MSTHKTTPRRGANLLDVFPPETIFNIVEHVEIEDYLSLKLTCRRMAAHMPKTLLALVRGLEVPTEYKRNSTMYRRTESGDAQKRRQFLREVVTTCLHHVENRMIASMPSDYSRNLLCSWCGRHKLPGCYMDEKKAPINYQRVARFMNPECLMESDKRRARTRRCLDCMHSLPSCDHWLSKFKYGGEHSFCCEICRSVLKIAEKAVVKPRNWIVFGLDRGWRRTCESCAHIANKGPIKKGTLASLRQRRS